MRLPTAGKQTIPSFRLVSLPDQLPEGSGAILPDHSGKEQIESEPLPSSSFSPVDFVGDHTLYAFHPIFLKHLPGCLPFMSE